MKPAPLSAEEVVRITSALRAEGLRVCVDRGFGVDALVGEVTRPHRDLDLLVAPGELDRATAILAALGFVGARTCADSGSTPELECRSSLGHKVDVREDSAVLAPDFTARGSLAGADVPCVSATHQLARRAAGRLRESDLHAFTTLRSRLGVTLPRGVPPLWLLRASLAARRLARRTLGRG